MCAGQVSRSYEKMTTSYREDFQPYSHGSGLQMALGVQFSTKPYAEGGVGGQFYTMIEAGTVAPAEESATFTTVVDGQKVLIA